MKSGFTLVEVLISAAIASMLSAALFVGWNQVNRGVVSADDMVSIFDRMMLVRKQFEHDFMGMCVPISRPYLKEKEKEEAAPATKPAQPAQPAEKETQKKEKPKPVERVFYATNQTGDIFESLTCLTNNPLQVYWSDRAGTAKPRIARIQYRLEQDPKTEKKPSYTLYRQEAYTLDFDGFQKGAEKPVRSYALITGIKEMKLTYWQETEVEKEVKQDDKTTKEKKKEIKKITTWDLDKEQPPKNAFIRPIPTMISVDLTLWDLQKKKSHAFTFLVPIPIDIKNPEEDKKKDTSAPAQQAQPSQTEQTVAAPQAPAAAQPAQPSTAPSGEASPPVVASDAIPAHIETENVTFLATESPLKALLLNEKGIIGGE